MVKLQHMFLVKKLCIFPDPPPPGSVPSCSEAGYWCSPGLVGIQAIEAVKYLLGIGDVLDGRMILIDALSMEFRTVKIGETVIVIYVEI